MIHRFPRPSSRPRARSAMLGAALVASLGLLSGCERGAASIAPTPDDPTVIGGVGTFALIVRDPLRDEPLTADPADRRVLGIRFWYPAAATTGAPVSAFLDPREAEANARVLGIPASVFDRIPTRARHRAPAAQGRWPLLVFSHGLRMSAPLYTRLGETLAERGWVVAALTHTGLAGASLLEDGSVVPTPPGGAPDLRATAATISADQRFVGALLTQAFATRVPESVYRELTVLHEHVDTSRMAVAGHSVGGAGAARTCSEDARFRACVDIDGTIDLDTSGRGTNRPFLLVNAEGALTRDVTRTGYLQWSSGARHVLELHGAKHNDFSDVPLLVAATDRDPADYAVGTVDTDAAARELERHVAGFLARYALGDDAEALPPERNGAGGIVTFRRWP